MKKHRTVTTDRGTLWFAIAAVVILLVLVAAEVFG